MDGVHDMGGMHGFGPIPIENYETPFPERWQGRVFACNLALTIQFGGNVDRFRFLIESMPPAEYLSSSYYERWLASMMASIEADGLLDAEQLAVIRSGAVPDVERDEIDTLSPEIIHALADHPAGLVRDMSGEAAFQRGDAVRARSYHPSGHTRLPRYVRGHRGQVVSDNGNQHLPDVRAETGEMVMQRLYTVSFTARELWGEQANPNDTVCLDLWESYLEPA